MKKLPVPFCNYTNKFFTRLSINPLYLWKLCRLTMDYNKAIKKGKNTSRYSKYFFTYGVEDSDFITAHWINNTLVFTFCGSDDIRDWISNLKFMRHTDREDVHGDFYHSAKNFRFFVRNLISMNIDKIDRIMFNGHSRGGPLAEESNRFFKKLKEESPQVYGGIFNEAVIFGAPMIGKRGYFNESLSLSLKVTRFEYQEDIVCKLPPFRSFVKYGNIIKLKKEWWHGLPFTKIATHLTYGNGLRKAGC